MAKRKRLILPFDPATDPVIAGSGPVGDGPEGIRAPETKALYPMGVAPPLAPPPIARVSSDAAATAALRDLADEVTRAREDGRLVQAVPLSAIDEGWIKRDRIGVDEDELTALIESLRAHGQRSAIEVVVLGQSGSAPAQKRYGLISGWRRLTALKRLFEETGEARFSTVLVIQRRPEGAGDAYVAMVEENEIRLGLSYYERARIAALAVRAGVFPSAKVALQRLYANVSRAKRSKIGSFLKIFEALDDALRFPAAIPERLGLAIAARIEADPAFARTLSDRLAAAKPDSATAEQSLVQRALKGQGAPTSLPGEELRPNLRLRATAKGVLLEGAGVDAQLIADLRGWLLSRGY